MNTRELTLRYEETEIYLEEFTKLPRKVQQLLFLKVVGTIPSVFFEEINSPIEQIFITAFEIYCDLLNKDFFYLTPQQKILIKDKTYVADFFIEYDEETKKGLVIECDGYDFHNLKKEQIMKDNEREFELKLEGYDVLRFSGSQIYRNPLKCAEDTYKYIEKYKKKNLKGEKYGKT